MGQVDVEGNAIQDLGNFVSEWNRSFEFKFILPENLTSSERSVFDLTGRIAELVGGLPSRVQGIKISETMRPETGSFAEARGLWTGAEIIIKRSELASIEDYASVLLHEIAHARSGETDITLGFEQELTKLLGMVAFKVLREATIEGRVFQESAKIQVAEIPAAWQQLQVASGNSAPAKKTGFWARLFGID